MNPANTPPVDRPTLENKAAIMNQYLAIADLLDKNMANARVLMKVKDDILNFGRGCYIEHPDGTMEYYDLIENKNGIKP
jgi:hypothetical protein